MSAFERDHLSHWAEHEVFHFAGIKEHEFSNNLFPFTCWWIIWWIWKCSFFHFWNTEYHVKNKSCQLNSISECICIVCIIIFEIKKLIPIHVLFIYFYFYWYWHISLTLQCCIVTLVILFFCLLGLSLSIFLPFCIWIYWKKAIVLSVICNYNFFTIVIPYIDSLARPVLLRNTLYLITHLNIDDSFQVKDI